MAQTLEDLALALQTAASESAKTNLLINDEVIPRLGRVEEMVAAAGLNGHTALLKKFLDDYAAEQSLDKSWAVVRADIGQRFRFLSQPKSWLKALFYAAIGGLGWKLVSGFPPIHF